MGKKLSSANKISENFDSLYNTMTTSRYSNAGFYNSANSDLLSNLRSKFLI